MKDIRSIDGRYLESCRKEFWQKVFQLELEYLVEHLKVTKYSRTPMKAPQHCSSFWGRKGRRSEDPTICRSWLSSAARAGRAKPA
jgi:hypothetical protein